MNFLTVKLIIFLVASIPCSIWDGLKYRVPLFIVFAGAAGIIASHFYFHGLVFSWILQQSLIGVAVVVLILVVARLITGDGLGWGDVFFGILSALFVGYPFFCVVSLGVSAVLGLLFYLIFSFTIKRKYGKGVVIHHRFAIPYVPFMTAGSLLTYWLLWINWLNK